MRMMTVSCSRINSWEPFRRPLDLSSIFNTCTRSISQKWQALPSLTRYTWFERCNGGRYLYLNQLSGIVPSTIGSLTNLVHLYDILLVTIIMFILATTQLNSTHSISHSNTCLIHSSTIGSLLGSNQLSGTIPSTIGSLTNLQALYDNGTTLHSFSIPWSSFSISDRLVRLAVWWQSVAVEWTLGSHSIGDWIADQSSTAVRGQTHLLTTKLSWYLPYSQLLARDVETHSSLPNRH